MARSNLDSDMRVLPVIIQIETLRRLTDPLVRSRIFTATLYIHLPHSARKLATDYQNGSLFGTLGYHERTTDIDLESSRRELLDTI